MTWAGGLAAYGVAAVNPQCRFERSCFLIGHMRCGSTALSAILVSRDDLSGYGEAHIAYTSRARLGQLVINQWRRGVWKRSARGLFDKILHNRYDIAAPAAFFTARAVFMAREPLAAIISIRALFADIDSGEYATDEEAAQYYCERLAAMFDLFARFPPSRRVALTYEALVASPEATLAEISGRLGIEPPLANSYKASAASQARGGGDPVTAPRFDRIVTLPPRPPGVALQVSPATLAQANALFERFRDLCEGNK